MKPRRLIVVFGVLSVLVVAAVLVTGDALLKLDYGRINSRAGWQLPDRVIASLEIAAGDRVADIGAGGGYFTFLLAEAVGPSGKVYAVDVDDGVVRDLRQKAMEKGYSNVEVVLARVDDPMLPDGEIDLVLLCNAYHHIDNRSEYFARLRSDLTPGGRVGVIDMKTLPLVRMFVPSGHWISEEAIQEEMRSAGYRTQKELGFLPLQSFLLFESAAR